MLKNDSCNLTKSEWKYLLNVFEEHYEYADEPDKAYKKLHNLHMKIFFMDALVKQMEDQDV